MRDASGYELINELQERTQRLDTMLSLFKKRGQALAQAEHDYKIAIAEKILIERAKGTAVTIMSDLCRGDKNIARLRFNRDVAQTEFDSVKEAINIYKLQIRVIQETIDKEYYNGGTGK